MDTEENWHQCCIYSCIGCLALLESCADRHPKIESSSSVCDHQVSVFILLTIHRGWDHCVHLLSPVMKWSYLVSSGDGLWYIDLKLLYYIVYYALLTVNITYSYLPFFHWWIIPSKIWNIVQCNHRFIHTQNVLFWQTTLSLRMDGSWIWTIQKGEQIKQKINYCKK